MMKRFFSILLMLGSVSTAQPERIPPAARTSELAEKVLDRRYIHITGAGSVDVPYPQALLLMDQADLLTSVQAAYVDLLDEGCEPEFEIILEEPGRYSYVNAKDQRTEITELLRGRAPEGATELVLYAKGKRSFGKFQSLTHVTVAPDPESTDRSRWDVQVFAYPENGFSRFFARNFGIAQRYFTRKTADIAALASQICLHMIQREHRAAVEPESHDPFRGRPRPDPFLPAPDRGGTPSIRFKLAIAPPTDTVFGCRNNRKNPGTAGSG